MKYYEGHEGAYQRLVSEGFVGWDRQRDLAALLAFPYRARLIDILSRLLPPGLGSVLDVGCGTGPVALSLAILGYEVTGIDISETAIRKAREIALEMSVTPKFICADFFEVVLPEASFQCAIDSSFLHCIVYDEERAQVFEKIHQILKPGGIFVLHTMVADDEFNFGANFRCDSTGILWYLMPQSSKDKNKQGSHLEIPQRRILPSIVIKNQMVQSGFREVLSEIIQYPRPGPGCLFAVFQR